MHEPVMEWRETGEVAVYSSCYGNETYEN